MSRAGITRTVLGVYLLTVAGTAAWLAAIFLAPALAARGSAGAARLIYAAFSPICHQIPGRCFAFHGHPLAVCGRCLGIYAGFGAGLALYPFVRGFSKLALPSARLFILMTLPLALDGAVGVIGLWASPIGVRFATGVIWGTVLPFFFVTGVADLVDGRKKRAAARALEKNQEKNVE
jgi:uncharacterized membrane protein